MAEGSLACSPFHVRFGKFSLLRPYEKKVICMLPLLSTIANKTIVQVEFKVNDLKQHHAMKLGEGGEAFFVFETSDEIPESMQTSPVISPAASPQSLSEQDVSSAPTLQEPEYLDLNIDNANESKQALPRRPRPMISDGSRAKSDYGIAYPA